MHFLTCFEVCVKLFAFNFDNASMDAIDIRILLLIASKCFSVDLVNNIVDHVPIRRVKALEKRRQYFAIISNLLQMISEREIIRAKK